MEELLPEVWIARLLMLVFETSSFVDSGLFLIIADNCLYGVITSFCLLEIQAMSFEGSSEDLKTDFNTRFKSCSGKFSSFINLKCFFVLIFQIFQTIV